MNYIYHNTNRKFCDTDDADMLLNNKAAAYEEKKNRVKSIQKDDRVFLHRSRVGIVAVGTGSGEYATKDYHGDTNKKDEECCTPLNDFQILSKPLSANEIRGLTAPNFPFNGTTHKINIQYGGILWDYIIANCI